MKKLREKLTAFVFMSHFYRVRGVCVLSTLFFYLPSKESKNNEYFLRLLCLNSIHADSQPRNNRERMGILSLFCSIFLGSVLIIPWECLIVANSLRWSIQLTFPPCPERISVQQQQSHVVHCKKHSWKGPFCLVFEICPLIARTRYYGLIL